SSTGSYQVTVARLVAPVVAETEPTGPAAGTKPVEQRVRLRPRPPPADHRSEGCGPSRTHGAAAWPPPQARCKADPGGLLPRRPGAVSGGMRPRARLRGRQAQ